MPKILKMLKNNHHYQVEGTGVRGSFTAVKQAALCHVLSGKRGEREYLPMLLLTKHIHVRAGLLPVSFVG